MPEFDAVETSQFLPNGSYFYNVETKRLHRGELDETGALKSAGSVISPLTFNLVGKEYPTDDRPHLEPTKFYSVLEFPTTQTARHLLALVKSAVSEFSVVLMFGKTVAPRKLSDSPSFVAIGPEGDEVILGARDLSYEAAEKGDAAVVMFVKNALRGNGFF